MGGRKRYKVSKRIESLKKSDKRPPSELSSLGSVDFLQNISKHGKDGSDATKSAASSRSGRDTPMSSASSRSGRDATKSAASSRLGSDATKSAASSRLGYEVWTPSESSRQEYEMELRKGVQRPLDPKAGEMRAIKTIDQMTKKILGEDYVEKR
jgi:hypothetical protein